MTRTRSSRRHGVTEQPRPARDEVLGRVMLCVKEPIASRRLGRGLAISRESRTLMEASLASWARTDEERDDLLAQACELAKDLVEREWSNIEPLVRKAGGMAFGDLSALPDRAFGLPTYPMPGLAMAKPGGFAPDSGCGLPPGRPRDRRRHRLRRSGLGGVLELAPACRRRPGRGDPVPDGRHAGAQPRR